MLVICLGVDMTAYIQKTAYRLNLLGVFSLAGTDGRKIDNRIDISSKRGRALIAALAVAPGGQRSRKWLQNLLWCNRDDAQGAASLRRELSTLRKLLNGNAGDLISADSQRIWIALDQIQIDLSTQPSAGGNIFLEGLDIAGEENFEDWLRECRQDLDLVHNEQTGEMPSSVPPNIMEPDHHITHNASLFNQPAIAVLPFSSGPKQDGEEALAHGLAEDLIDRLSRQRWLPVIARSSSFVVSKNDGTLKNLGQKLNARFIVHGRLITGETGRALAAALDDCETGQQIWAGQYPLATEHNPTQAEDILWSVAAALGISVDQYLQRSAMRCEGRNEGMQLSVAENIWRGRWHLHRLTRHDFAEARRYFDTALRIDPISSEAILHQAWLCIWQLWVQRGSLNDFRKSRRMAQQAIIAEPNDARGHMLAGIAEIWMKQPLRAEALLLRAIALNPSLAMAHAQLGSALLAKGEYEAAIESLEVAVRLSPSDSEIFYMLGEIALAQFFLGCDEEAIRYAEEALSWRGGYWQAHMTRINALWRMGDNTQADAAYAELIETSPNFSAAHVDWLPFLDPDKPAILKCALNQLRERYDIRK